MPGAPVRLTGSPLLHRTRLVDQPNGEFVDRRAGVRWDGRGEDRAKETPPRGRLRHVRSAPPLSELVDWIRGRATVEGWWQRTDLQGKPAWCACPMPCPGVVLQFLLLPFTRTCLAQMWAVRDDVDRYSGQGVTVLGVTGHYPQLIAAWDRENDFAVTILAVYEHEVSRAYVGLYEDVLPLNLRLTTKRGVVGISPDGRVGYTWTAEMRSEAPSHEVHGSWTQPSEPQRADSGAIRAPFPFDSRRFANVPLMRHRFPIPRVHGHLITVLGDARNGTHPLVPRPRRGQDGDLHPQHRG